MTGVTPRAVVVHRRTELDLLVAQHGTRGQAQFFLETRGRDLTELERRDRSVRTAMAAVARAIPLDWRRGIVERAELDRFVFEPDDLVIIVGQDGLVANVAKYLDGHRVIGVDPEPDRNPGVLVRHPPEALPDLLRGSGPIESLTMVEARTDDGQCVRALNEIFLGHPSHQTARYTLRAPGGRSERQASSGILIATGTGSTGWCRSAWLERRSPLRLPQPTEPRLLWFVREAWPSPVTGTTSTEGELVDAPLQVLQVVVETDGLVAFGDGIEEDHFTLRWGQEVRIGLARETLQLVV